MTGGKIYRFNANPWKKHVGDCAIRAVVMAIGMRYELVCRELGVAWKRGTGLVRDTGIDLERIKKAFGGYFDKVEDYGEEMPDDLASDPAFADLQAMDAAMGVGETTAGITLGEFLDLYEGQGVFLVGLVGNPEAEDESSKNPDDGHIVCARCLRGKQGYAIDTFDSSEMIVDSFMRIRKTVPRDDPRHWVYDRENKCFVGYGLTPAEKAADAVRVAAGGRPRR